MKTRLISSATILLGTSALSSIAFAENAVCAASQDDSWMEPEALQQQVETLGYTIETMGISEGCCYQPTGLNDQGQSVTAYLDPVSGMVVQEDIAQ